MSVAIPLVSLVCGLLTLGFIINGLVQQARGKGGRDAKTFLVVSLLSLLTAAFTTWQLALALGDVHW